MTSRTSKPPVDRELIEHGSGNVFADLGYADAEERQTKLRLAYAINSVIKQRGLTQASTTERLGISSASAAALADYELRDFASERLRSWLTAVDQDVESGALFEC